MKAIFNKRNILDVLSKLVLIPAQRGVSPIFDCFKFDVGTSITKVWVTNESTQVIYSMDVSNQEEFSFCVNAKLFWETIRLFSADEITIELQEKAIVMKNGRSKYKLATYHPEDYPVFDCPESDSKMKLKVEEFVAGVRKAASNVLNNDKVPVMAGISLRCELGKLSISGSVHNSIINHDIDVDKNSFTECVITSQSANAAFNILQGHEIGMVLSSKKLKLITDSCIITCVLIDYKYPDIRRFWSMKAKEYIELNRLDLLKALGRLKLYVEKNAGACVTFEAKEGLLYITGSDLFQNNFGEEQFELADKSFTHVSKYMLENLYSGLSSIDGDNIYLHFPSTGKAMFISGKELTMTEFIIMQIM